MRTSPSPVRATAALVYAIAAYASAVAAATCGDLNGNGSLTIADCVVLVDGVAGPPDPPSLCGGAGPAQCGDLNADGTVNVADVVICLNAVAGNETLFPLCAGRGECYGFGHSPVVLDSDVTTNVSLCPGEVFLDGTVFVHSGAVLTVLPGTTIKAKKVSTNASPSFLVFQCDAKINAAGTPSQPIVFTSDQPPGSRADGDWGGLMLNGRAPVNTPGGEAFAEGLPNTPFGGSEPNDSRGILR